MPGKAGKDWTGELALTGWQRKRRVVLLRRALTGEIAVAGNDADDRQQQFAFVEADRKAGKSITGYEYAVLVTNIDTRCSASASFTATGPMRNTPSTNSRTSAAGAALPRTTCAVAYSPRAARRWSSTGGAFSCAWLIPTPGARRSPAGRG